MSEPKVTPAGVWKCHSGSPSPAQWLSSILPVACPHPRNQAGLEGRGEDPEPLPRTALSSVCVPEHCSPCGELEAGLQPQLRGDVPDPSLSSLCPGPPHRSWWQNPSRPHRIEPPLAHHPAPSKKWLRPRPWEMPRSTGASVSW